MTEITDLSTTDASNTAITGESLDGNVANMGRMDNTLQAILGMLARSIRSNVFRLLDNTDATKKVAFDLSGLTTATTRTVTVPDASGTMALTGAAHTWTAAQTFSAAVTVNGAFTSVGIDDNATGERLQVADTATVFGTAGAAYVLGHSAADQALFISGSNSSTTGASLRLYGDTHATQASDWEFKQGSTNVLSYDHSANRINAVAPIEHGTWSATGASRGNVLTVDANTAILLTSATATSSAQHVKFYNPNGQVGSIATSASATAYNTSSDERLKEDFSDFDSGAIVDAIEVYQYAWKADGSVGYGPKAQQLHGVFQQAVTPGNDKEPGDPEFYPWSYDPGKLVPVLLKEIQSLRARVSALEI